MSKGVVEGDNIREEMQRSDHEGPGGLCVDCMRERGSDLRV